MCRSGAIALRMALLALPLCVPASTQLARPDPPGRLIDLGGYRVHLYCTGSGSPAVMVVGSGFSFDWGLVQPEVSKFTTVCTYDLSGTAWSDPGPALNCRERVNEVRKLVRAAHLGEPLVLTGLSLGGCVARLYAAQYPSAVSGMVIVDHAFLPDPDPDAAKSALGASEGVDSPPVLIYQAPIEITVEDGSNFSQLPERIRRLHAWAASLHPKLPTWEDAADCLAQLKTASGPFPLGELPLAIVSTNNQARGYSRLQSGLLALSRRSFQMLAGRSFHSVEIDQPEVVVAAIRRVVESARGTGH
jgi:pimeloyl-ACP methyl ester carboxylesterase